MTMFFAKKLNKKGFTLAELLIVVAIIAVLVAIAIPVFAGALEKARYGVHEANARTLKTLGATRILADIDTVTLTGDDIWYVEGTYDFSKEEWTTIKYTKTTGDVQHFKAGNGTVTLTDSEKAIGRLATSGSVNYLTYVTAQELAD